MKQPSQVRGLAQTDDLMVDLMLLISSVLPPILNSSIALSPLPLHREEAEGRKMDNLWRLEVAQCALNLAIAVQSCVPSCYPMLSQQLTTAEVAGIAPRIIFYRAK